MTSHMSQSDILNLSVLQLILIMTLLHLFCHYGTLFLVIDDDDDDVTDSVPAATEITSICDQSSDPPYQ